MATLVERLDALVDRTGGHDLWLGATDQHGVPQIRVDGRLTTARRVAWELHHGPIPAGVRVMACPANPRCVHAEHLAVRAPRAAPSRSRRVRRARGGGSLRQVRAGVWQLTVTAETGQRVYRTHTGDRASAANALATLAAQHGQAPFTLDALVSVYLAHLETSGRSHTTLRRYAQLWRTWFAPSLGETHPDDLRRADIEQALTAMHDAGQSERSIHQGAVVLNTALAWAREQQIARANPVIGCELPNGTTLTTTRHR